MSHELDFLDGEARMAYTGETPWHSHGNPMKPGQSIERWIDGSLLTFGYRLAPLYVEHTTADATQRGHKVEVAKYRAVQRTDNNAVLGVVSPGFQLVQPREAVEFFRDLVETGRFELETAGALKEGAVVWAMAKHAKLGALRVLDEDEIRCRLLLMTATDTSMATIVKFVSERVVCRNTLDMALDGGGGEIKVPHSTAFDPDEVKRRLGLLGDVWERHAEQVNKLARRHVEPAEIRAWMFETFGDPDQLLELGGDSQTLDALKTLTGLRTMKKVYALFAGQGQGASFRSSKGTAWGLVNAATEFVDHHRSERAPGNRLHSAWAGTGAALKHAAFENALKLVA